MSSSSSWHDQCGRVEVHVVSDFACPWCYVGKAHLKGAIEAFKRKNPDGPQIDVSMGPYMIDTATQPGGEEYMAYNVRRWGGDGWTGSLRRSGRNVGCNFAKWKVWPNSSLAHQLQRFADKAGKGNEINDLIFQTIYERGDNASDMETLVALASEAGLSPTDARSCLSSRQEENVVVEEDIHAKRVIGVKGVPYFQVSSGARDAAGRNKGGEQNKGNTVILEGAADINALLQALERASKNIK